MQGSETYNNDKILSEMKEMRKALEAQANTPASAVTKANGLFGHAGFEPAPANGQPRPWPTQLIKQLSDAYSDDLVNAWATRSRGRIKALGLGPHLARMGSLVQSNLPPNHAQLAEQLHNAGFVSLAHAKEVGIKQLNGEVRKVALAEGSGVTGGYVVPPQYQAELLAIAAEDAFVEPKAHVVPMTTRTLTYPMLDITTRQAAGTSPYYGGVLATWQPEAQQISETEPTFRQTNLVAYDLVLYSVCSNQLIQDNAIGLDTWITQLFSGAMTWYKEYAFLRGTGAGASMPLGVLNAPATYVQSRGAGTTFTIVDMAAMFSRLQPRSWDNAMWIMHQSVLPQLIRMTNNATNAPFLTWLNPVPGGGAGGPLTQKLPRVALNGLPIEFTEKMPTLGTKGDVSLIDWSHYLIGARMDIQIEVSPHVAFRTNQLAWRVIIRCDGQPWLNNTIVDASGWEQSPFVVLNT